MVDLKLKNIVGGGDHKEFTQLLKNKYILIYVEIIYIRFVQISIHYLCNGNWWILFFQFSSSNLIFGGKFFAVSTPYNKQSSQKSFHVFVYNVVKKQFDLPRSKEFNKNHVMFLNFVPEVRITKFKNVTRCGRHNKCRKENN